MNQDNCEYPFNTTLLDIIVKNLLPRGDYLNKNYQIYLT